MIPEVVGPVLEERGDNVVPYVFPTHCPVCGEQVYREADEVAFRCENVSCPAILLRSMVHFVSKDGLDIVGFGEKWVEQFVKSGRVKSYADLFRLTQDDFLAFKRSGTVLAQKCLDALNAAKSRVTPERFLTALGIRHVGVGTARTLAAAYATIDDLAKAGIDELQSLPDIGPEVAQSIRHFFSLQANIHLLDDLRSVGVWPEKNNEPENAANAAESGTDTEQQHAAPSPLQGKTILFTGSLSCKRSIAEEYAMRLGAIPVGSVSKRLGYLVVGEKPGSKLTKAQALGVPILTEEEFFTILRNFGITVA